MADTGKIVRGIVHYLDDELLPQMDGLPKVIGGIGMGMFMKNAQGTLESYKDKEWARMIGLVDEHGEYNLPQVYEETLKMVRKDPIVFELPMFGRITMREGDVSKLYTYINNA